MSSSPPNSLTDEDVGPIAGLLLKVVGKQASLLADEAQYRRLVIDPGWDLMPVPVRLLGREHLGWDRTLLALRDEVFEVRAGSVRLREDYRGRLLGRLGAMLTLPGGGSGGAPAGAPAAWYVRSRGRVTGPFPNAAIATLVQRGQLARFHEVSVDREVWQSAGEVLPVFQRAPAPAPARASAPASHGPAAGSGDGYGLIEESEPERRRRENRAVGWFIGRGSTPVGPVPFTELERLVDTGEVGPETLLWNEAMPDWVPASEVPEIAPRLGAATAPPPNLPRGAASSRPAQAPEPVPGMAYPGPGVAMAYGPPRTSGLAIASLVLGLLWLGGLGSLLAIIFGSVAVGQVNKSNGQVIGKGIAWSGLILGIIGLALIVIVAASTSPGRF